MGVLFIVELVCTKITQTLVIVLLSTYSDLDSQSQWFLVLALAVVLVNWYMLVFKYMCIFINIIKFNHKHLTSNLKNRLEMFHNDSQNFSLSSSFLCLCLCLCLWSFMYGYVYLRIEIVIKFILLYNLLTFFVHRYYYFYYLHFIYFYYCYLLLLLLLLLLLFSYSSCLVIVVILQMALKRPFWFFNWWHSSFTL